MIEKEFTPRDYFYGFLKLAAVIVSVMAFAWYHV